MHVEHKSERSVTRPRANISMQRAPCGTSLWRCGVCTSGELELGHGQVVLVSVPSHPLDYSDVLRHQIDAQRDGVANHKVAHIRLLLLRHVLAKLPHILHRGDDLVAHERDFCELLERLVGVRDEDERDA